MPPTQKVVILVGYSNNMEVLIEQSQMADVTIVLSNLLNGAAIVSCVAFIGTLVGVFFNLNISLILPTTAFCGTTTIGWYIAKNYCKNKMCEYDGV
jgi:hypothetical protein